MDELMTIRRRVLVERLEVRRLPRAPDGIATLVGQLVSLVAVAIAMVTISPVLSARAVALAGLEPLLAALPDGLNTVLAGSGGGGMVLSAGL